MADLSHNPQKERWAFITHWLKVIIFWTVVLHLLTGVAFGVFVVSINRFPGLFVGGLPRFHPTGEAPRILDRLAPRLGQRTAGEDEPLPPGSLPLEERPTEEDLSRVLSAWADEAMDSVSDIRTAVAPLRQHRPTTLPVYVGWLAPFDKRATRLDLDAAFRGAGVGTPQVSCGALKTAADHLSHTAQEDQGATYLWWWHNGTGKELAALIVEEARRRCRLMKKHIGWDRLARLQPLGATCPVALDNWRRGFPEAPEVLNDPFGDTWKCRGERLLYGVGPDRKDNGGNPRKDQVVVVGSP